MSSKDTFMGDDPDDISIDVTKKDSSLEDLLLSLLQEQLFISFVPNKRNKKQEETFKRENRDIYILLVDFASNDIAKLINNFVNEIKRFPYDETRFVLCFRYSDQYESFVIPHIFTRGTTNMLVLTNWITKIKQTISVPMIPTEKLGEYMSRFSCLLECVPILQSREIGSHIVRYII